MEEQQPEEKKPKGMGLVIIIGIIIAVLFIEWLFTQM